ncbi:MAG: TRAP transporter large permease [Desulfobacteraceae bacterium]|nr:MAG: TRAP transporter large permease [Desulfobacteraceae bacterium]
MLVGIIMFIALFVLLLSGMPIAGALGLVGLGSIIILDVNLLKGISSVVWNNSTNFVLAAAPLFVLMGEIMVRSGTSAKFYRAISVWVRWLPGGLLQANLAACTIFAAVSGSSVATAATMGTVAIPEMVRLKYDKGLIYGSLAAGGTLGILIPPSIAMIIYGSLTNESVGRLFIGGIIPGFLMAAMFAVYIMIRAALDKKIAPVEASSKMTPRELLLSTYDIAPTMLLLIVIIGGIYLGWATPTEIAALGVAFSLLIAVGTRQYSWQKFGQSLIYTVSMTSMLLFVIIGAQVFSFALFSWGATFEIATQVVSLQTHPLVVWTLVIIAYLFLGMFIDAISMMVLTVMVVQPIIVQLGFDSLWFGVTLVLLLEIGLITPPVGLNLYAIKAVADDASFKQIVSGSFPFVILLLVGILFLTIFPQLVLWLPSKIF